MMQWKKILLLLLLIRGIPILRFILFRKINVMGIYNGIASLLCHKHGRLLKFIDLIDTKFNLKPADMGLVMWTK